MSEQNFPSNNEPEVLEPDEVLPPKNESETASDSNYENDEKYQDDMLMAFVQKPDKMSFYKSALKNMTRTGELRFQFQWSWWAFIATWAFLLYRKVYLAAFITFLVTLLVPGIGWLVLMIVLGGVAPYFVVKRYVNLKREVEFRYQGRQDRIDAMREAGGYHSWVIWVVIILNLLTFFVVTPFILGALMIAGSS